MTESNAEAGPSQRPVTLELASLAARSQPANPNEASNPATKIAKNKRLPATMVTPGGQVEASRKKGKQESAKKKKRSEKGKEKALELSNKLENKVRDREDKKAKRQRAKKAWE